MQRFSLPTLKSRRNAKRTGRRQAEQKSRTPRRLRCESLELRTLMSATAEWASGVVDFSSQYGTTTFSAAQATGAPNTTSYGDYGTAWAAKSRDGTTESLTLSYATPVYANGVSVRETCGNGFVTKIEVRNVTTGTFETVWSGSDTTPQDSPGDLNVTFAQRSYKVDAMRLTVNTSASTNWEEIDAVKLLGDTGTTGTPGTPVTVGLQNGSSGYNGMVDTRMNKSSPTSAYTNATTLFASNNSGSLLRWDLSKIPAGAVVTSAKLSLSVTDKSNSSYELYQANRPWAETTATWNKATSSASWQIAGAQGTKDRATTVLGSLTAPTTGRKTVDLNAAGLAAVQGWINTPASNYGFAFQDYAGTDSLAYSSSEVSIVSLRPKLEITYTIPGTATNVAPTVSAGSDRGIALGAAAALDGTVADDGLPNPPGAVTQTWTKISGPGTVTFANANAVDTTANFNAGGTYVLRLTASDGVLSTSDDMTVTVGAQNAPPAVNAGPDRSVTLGNAAALDGTVTDDGLPNPPAAMTQTWTKISGPGTVTFANATAVDTTANFNAGGTYVLRLTASDGVMSASDDVTVTVGVQNAPPVVNAGADKSVNLPSTVSLAGTATDDGQPGPLTTTWSKVSGTGTVTFASASALSTTASFSTAGTYVIRLSGSDGSATATDDVTVTVSNPTTIPGEGVWISNEELMALPTSGTAWNSLVSAANTSIGTPNISNPDDTTDVYVLAKALVGVRTNNTTLITQARNAIMAAIGTETDGESVAAGRNIAPYVAAADLVGLSSTQETQFKSWLVKATQTTVYTDGRTLKQMHEERPNNWGLMAGASRAAAAAYLGNTAEMARVAQVLKGWMGDRSSYAGFSYGGPEDDLSWQIDQSKPVGVLPKGTVRDGHNLDGAMPEEMRRSGPYDPDVWPPVNSGYVWEALQGAFVQAEILHRAGYDAYNWQDQAMLRTVKFAYSIGWEAVGDDEWTPWLVDARYGTNYAVDAAAQPGKVMGWTNWTHQNESLASASLMAASAPEASDAALALDATSPQTTKSLSLPSEPLAVTSPTAASSSTREQAAADQIFAALPAEEMSPMPSIGGSSAEQDPLDAIGVDLALPQLRGRR